MSYPIYTCIHTCTYMYIYVCTYIYTHVRISCPVPVVHICIHTYVGVLSCVCFGCDVKAY